MKALFIALALVSITAQANASVKCAVKNSDVGPIMGVGATKEDAQADAAVKCFERHEAIQLNRTGSEYSADDAGYAVADACTNVRCG